MHDYTSVCKISETQQHSHEKSELTQQMYVFKPLTLILRLHLSQKM